LQALTEITTSLTAHDTANGLEALDKAIENGADPRQLARDLVEFFRSILLVQLGRESALVLGQEEREALKAFAGKLRAEELLRAIRLFNHAAFELRASSNPMLPLEMALVEANLEPASSSSPIQLGRSSAVVESRLIEPKRVIPSFARQDEPPKSHTAPAPEDKPSRVVAGGRLTLETARQHWGEIVAGMRSFNRQVEALLKDSQPTHLDKENLSIGFGSKFHVDKMDAETKAKAQLEKLILEVFGEKRHVRYVISPKKQKLKAAESDPVISTALNLGGEITDLHDDETKE
jgi:DNA polymerase-3 subunit gamma/tau